MKKILFISIFLMSFLSNCGNKEGEQTNDASDSTKIAGNENGPTKLSDKDYQEYYESGALKVEGDLDENDARNGLWLSYYENGFKWSESMYVHGLKNGHSVTFFPNGKIRYVGEYKDDEKSGNWKFYDEAGLLVSEENY